MTRTSLPESWPRYWLAACVTSISFRSTRPRIRAFTPLPPLARAPSSPSCVEPGSRPRSASTAAVTSWRRAANCASPRSAARRSPSKSMVKISASILNADFGHLADSVQRAEAGGSDWIHVDVMDGAFVHNLTLGPSVVEAIRRATSLPLDVHLMIDNPARYVSAFRDAGGDW